MHNLFIYHPVAPEVEQRTKLSGPLVLDAMRDSARNNSG